MGVTGTTGYDRGRLDDVDNGEDHTSTVRESLRPQVYDEEADFVWYDGPTSLRSYLSAVSRFVSMLWISTGRCVA